MSSPTRRRRERLMTPERAANIEAHARSSAEFRSLPRETQKRIIEEFRSEKQRGGGMCWAHYLTVTLLHLPDEARSPPGTEYRT